MEKEIKECNHEWSLGVTIYQPLKCDICGKVFEHEIPE